MGVFMNEKVSTLSTLIRERRSIRDFKTDPIPLQDMVELLNDAVYAPNHGKREPWRFIAFEGKGKKKFADAVIDTYNAEQKENKAAAMEKYYQDIPLHLLVVMPEDPRQKKWEEDICAVSAMIQNFQLLAWEKGIGVCWKTNAYNLDPIFREAVGVQPGEKIVATLHIGYYEIVPKAKKRTSVEDKLVVIND
ncbi:nitroreductase [Alkalihalobacillus alcalophilus ATCC 27647 = CGMCC 1.3604]|uniref:Putative NAD(P)H nitroreductase n=1 Tax=Alkalihalobacillus alcalophilus ATCC 27647 = CGMCC 1.3604 TaxID=1218173 RepID=A0A094WHJ4_ALKAL|nr:nitroreductase [Alkalihalobacillus alcalophilus]KGA96256.1 nitroreductase [Alkalihalobacillus alcalophilus ATCC 27647 = CGMCC 1.3604]MED1562329.1 nitroreductase [Alkalihalobacillus alcalophilus]THG90636.1 nitroreductase [Alkalihalobacillus alcalophilus ATCC 27647 = CGMCC 1.3604]